MSTLSSTATKKRTPYGEISIATWRDPSLSVHPARGGLKTPLSSPEDFARPFSPRYKVKYELSDDEGSGKEDNVKKSGDSASGATEQPPAEDINSEVKNGDDVAADTPPDTSAEPGDNIAGTGDSLASDPPTTPNESKPPPPDSSQEEGAPAAGDESKVVDEPVAEKPQRDTEDSIDSTVTDMPSDPPPATEAPGHFQSPTLDVDGPPQDAPPPDEDAGTATPATEDTADERRVSFAPGTPEPAPRKKKSAKGTKGKKKRITVPIDSLPPDILAMIDSGFAGLPPPPPAPEPPSTVDEVGDLAPVQDEPPPAADDLTTSTEEVPTGDVAVDGATPPDDTPAENIAESSEKPDVATAPEAPTETRDKDVDAPASDPPTEPILDILPPPPEVPADIILPEPPNDEIPKDATDKPKKKKKKSSKSKDAPLFPEGLGIDFSQPIPSLEDILKDLGPPPPGGFPDPLADFPFDEPVGSAAENGLDGGEAAKEEKEPDPGPPPSGESEAGPAVVDAEEPPATDVAHDGGSSEPEQPAGDGEDSESRDATEVANLAATEGEPPADRVDSPMDSGVELDESDKGAPEESSTDTPTDTGAIEPQDMVESVAESASETPTESKVEDAQAPEAGDKGSEESAKADHDAAENVAELGPPEDVAGKEAAEPPATSDEPPAGGQDDSVEKAAEEKEAAPDADPAPETATSEAPPPGPEADPPAEPAPAGETAEEPPSPDDPPAPADEPAAAGPTDQPPAPASPPSPNLSKTSSGGSHKRRADHWERKHADRPRTRLSGDSTKVFERPRSSGKGGVETRVRTRRRYSNAEEEEEHRRRRKERKAEEAARAEEEERRRVEEERDRRVRREERKAEKLEERARRIREEAEVAAKRDLEARQRRRHREGERRGEAREKRDVTLTLPTIGLPNLAKLGLGGGESVHGGQRQVRNAPRDEGRPKSKRSHTEGHAEPPSPKVDEGDVRPASSSGSKSHHRPRHHRHRSEEERSTHSGRSGEHRARRPAGGEEGRSQSFFSSLFRRA